MATTGFEPLLRKATIKAIDTVSRKAAKTEKAAENAIGKLLARWNAMTDDEKEQVAGIVIATATTAVTAVAALRASSNKKKTVKKAAGKGVRKVAQALLKGR
jgi:hypothetical protein